MVKMCVELVDGRIEDGDIQQKYSVESVLYRGNGGNIPHMERIPYQIWRGHITRNRENRGKKSQNRHREIRQRNRPNRERGEGGGERVYK